MKALAQQNGTVTPAVHLEFIQNQAGLPEDRGLAEIEAYHRALLLHHHAREMEMNAQQARIHQDRLDRLETQLKEVSARLIGQDKVVPVAADGQLDTKP